MGKPLILSAGDSVVIENCAISTAAGGFYVDWPPSSSTIVISPSRVQHGSLDERFVNFKHRLAKAMERHGLTVSDKTLNGGERG